MLGHALVRTISYCVALMVGLSVTAASAQVRISGGISGSVADNTGGVIPGATVVLKDEGTGVQKDTTTNERGLFAFPDLSFGSYTVTVTLQGFQTAEYKKVAVSSGRTTDLRVSLQPGGLSEVITVEGTAPVLEASSNIVSNTLDNKQLNELPLAGRNAFVLARLVPGAVAPQGTGSTHYNGMPGGTINPTIDGINNSSNGWKSGGTSFFGTVPARIGAIEEVTVETSGQGAESGSGGVNLKFVTRRGTNQYRGSVFDQARNEYFNANSFSNNARNLPKNKLRRHDFGGNFGGPMVPAGALRDKLFLFVNYEQEYIPQTQTRQRTLLQAQAQAGVFTYRTAAGELRSANVLDIARANGFPTALDPLMQRQLAGQNSSRQYGVVETENNLNTETLSWIEPQTNTNYYPTARMDYQIRSNLAWMGSWNLYRQAAEGRRGWPLPGYPLQLDVFHASWWITSTGLNWSINSNTHNEFRYGVQHSGDTIPYRERSIYEELNGSINGKPARFTLPLGLATLANDAAPITGRHYITTIYDTLTMIRGNHTFTTGGTFRLSDWRDTSFDAPGSAGFLGLPQYAIGSPTGDPVQSIYNTTSLPGIQNADLANVYALYAFLTGRVSSVTTGRILDPATLQYSDQVYRENWTASKMGGVYIQDRWRVKPNLTVNGGLRYEINGLPYSKLANANFPNVANLYGPSTALFQPGTLNGVLRPTIDRGDYAAGIDYNNFAPNAGFAWSPKPTGGFLAKIFGTGGDSVMRGDYSLTYYDEGTNMFAFNAGSNPGLGQSLRLQPGIGFQPGALTLQTPLPPFVAFPEVYKESFPQSDFTFSNGFRTMKDDLKTPYVHSWNIGIQRQIMKNTVIEARYVGTRGENVWRTYNLNEVNIFENTFLDEFKRAQSNLAISMAQPTPVSNFQNRGLPGQVPLPIFETAFGARGAQPALSAAQGFTNGGFITNLQQGTAGALANSLAGNANYVCRMFGNTFDPCTRLGYNAAGPYPINFFLLNPYAGTQGAWIVDDDSYTRYHALQLQLRRRYAQGVSMNVNYTLGKNTGDIWADNSTQEVNYTTLRNRALDNNFLPFDVRHVLQAFGTYDLPFGRDRHFSIANPILNSVVGGWTVAGTLTAQSGTPFRLSSGGRATFNQFDSGVILLNGLTVEELQKGIHMSMGPGLARYWIDPKYIGPDGRANPQYLAVPTTPGEMGQIVTLRSLPTWNLDAAMSKEVQIAGRTQLRIHVTMTNVLNHPIWGAPGFLNSSSIQSTTFGQQTAPLNGARQMYIRGEVRF
ncbi:MAG TPA: TonB-dependent receptor [Vicinamibacterales bacterium]|jgi:hypothetical protein